MGLNMALGSALSSLLAVETQMGLTSSNIANANTPGYTRETESTTTQVTDGFGTGVLLGNITNSVDQNLVRQISQATAQAGYASNAEACFQSLVQTMGQITTDSNGNASGTDISNALNSLQSVLQSLSDTPTSATLQDQSIAQLDNTLSLIRETSSQVQRLRTNADSGIAATVADINSQLNTINKLNSAIASATNSGQSPVALEDQRMTALQSLSSDTNVSYFIDGNNKMEIYIGGQVMVDGAGDVRQLSHTAVAQLTPQAAYTAGGSGTVDGIWLGGQDITGQINSGKLKALVDQRDTVLPQVQSELDNLSGSLANSFNQIFNQYTTSPPPGSLTGTQTFASGATATVASGTIVRVAITNSSGNVTAYQNVTLPAGSNTVASLESAIGAAVSGLGGSSSVGSQNQLTLSAPAGSGIAISTVSGSITPTGGTAQDAATLFGFNYLVTGGSSSITVTVRSDILATPTLLANYQQMSSLGTVGSSALATGGGTSIGTQLSNALLNSTSFSSVGALGAANTTFTGYAAQIVASVSTQSQVATTKDKTEQSALQSLQTSFSSQAGVNVDQESALMSQLQNSYAASARVVAAVRSMFQSLLSAVQA